jgi:radical SAM protein with 4Fe4S-binding SPASM domain
LKNQLLFPQIRESCKACQELALGIDYTNSVYPCSELIMDEYKIGQTNDVLTGGLYTKDKNCEVMEYLYMKMLEKIVELDIKE